MAQQMLMYPSDDSKAWPTTCSTYFIKLTLIQEANVAKWVVLANLSQAQGYGKEK